MLKVVKVKSQKSKFKSANFGIIKSKCVEGGNVIWEIEIGFIGSLIFQEKKPSGLKYE